MSKSTSGTIRPSPNGRFQLRYTDPLGQQRGGAPTRRVRRQKRPESFFELT